MNMRHGLVLAALLLPLGGCYVAPPPQPAYGYAAPSGPPPSGYGYNAPAGPPPGYAPEAYPQAAYAPGYDPYGDADPGYTYNGGAPTMIVAGAVVPLVVVGGAWGYYDGHHGWHRAPDQINRDIARQRDDGAAYHPGGGGYPPGRPPGSFSQPRPSGGPEPYHAQVAAPESYHAQPQYRPPPPQTRPVPEPQREEHQRGRECPPGQRC
jgi:hypothetical protein